MAVRCSWRARWTVVRRSSSSRKSLCFSDVIVVPSLYASCMPCEEHAAKRARARELRRAGWSRAQIARELRVRNSGTLTYWLKDIPVPEWTRRPRAKDELRDQAVALRLQGKSYREIKERLGVSKSSLSLWLRDVYLTEEQRQVLEDRRSIPGRKRAASLTARRIAETQCTIDSAREEIGVIAPEQLHVAGVMLYWAEGAKSKPWQRRERVAFTNSDPGLIRVFVRWLESLGIGKDDLIFRIAIHESANIERASRFWATELGVHPSRFLRPTLKWHNPKTVRKNVADTYVGCLTINVRRSTELYRRIAGWYEGIVESMGPGVMAASLPLMERGGGSNPPGPATLFEPQASYACERAS